MTNVRVKLSYSSGSKSWWICVRTVNGFGLLTLQLTETQFSQLIGENGTEAKVGYIDENIVKNIKENEDV